MPAAALQAGTRTPTLSHAHTFTRTRSHACTALVKTLHIVVCRVSDKEDQIDDNDKENDSESACASVSASVSDNKNMSVAELVKKTTPTLVRATRKRKLLHPLHPSRKTTEDNNNNSNNSNSSSHNASTNSNKMTHRDEDEPSTCTDTKKDSICSNNNNNNNNDKDDEDDNSTTSKNVSSTASYSNNNSNSNSNNRLSIGAKRRTLKPLVVRRTGSTSNNNDSKDKDETNNVDYDNMTPEVCALLSRCEALFFPDVWFLWWSRDLYLSIKNLLLFFCFANTPHTHHTRTRAYTRAYTRARLIWLHMLLCCDVYNNVQEAEKLRVEVEELRKTLKSLQERKR